ncbi:hypothetical protein ABZ618_01255 [Streptomyces roseolus]|uniref:hypothetical protein n=1 Tax=Streptomyces roseolus TaxID=67358 RepID=UPI0033D48620
MPHDDLAARTASAVTSYEHELARYERLRSVHGPAVPDGTTIAGRQLARILTDLRFNERPTRSWPLPDALRDTVEWPGP